MTINWSRIFDLLKWWILIRHIYFKNGFTERTDGEEENGHVVSVQGEPSGHPAEKKDAEEDEGGHVEEGVVAVRQAGLWDTGDDEKL